MTARCAGLSRAPPYAGIVNLSPGLTVSWELSPFAWRRSFSFTPNFSAMLCTVSPSCTVYSNGVRAGAGAAGGGLGGGGGGGDGVSSGVFGGEAGARGVGGGGGALP